MEAKNNICQCDCACHYEHWQEEKQIRCKREIYPELGEHAYCTYCQKYCHRVDPVTTP